MRVASLPHFAATAGSPLARGSARPAAVACVACERTVAACVAAADVRPSLCAAARGQQICRSGRTQWWCGSPCGCHRLLCCYRRRA
ncbi:hypothetical protein GW17_00046452 [Ensete ventricosum]|nr:hypothetical protein GW17_00046452 [Ensete ventricosum]